MGFELNYPTALSQSLDLTHHGSPDTLSLVLCYDCNGTKRGSALS